MFGFISIFVSTGGVGVDTVGMDVDVGVAVGDGVKVGTNVGVGVAVDGTGVGVFDGVAGRSDGIRSDVGRAIGAMGIQSDIDILVDADKGVSALGEVTVLEVPHATKTNNTIKQERYRHLVKCLIPLHFSMIPF